MVRRGVWIIIAASLLVHRAFRQFGPGAPQHSVGLTDEELHTFPKEARFFDAPYPPIPADVDAAIQSGPFDCTQALLWEDRASLLRPGNHSIENGWCGMEDGSHFVAVHTDMPGVSGEMLDWWFWWHSFRPLRYKLWHPREHVSAHCQHPERLTDDSLSAQQRYRHNTHRVVERINDDHIHEIAIEFLSPDECGLPSDKLDAAQVATIVCARVFDADKRAQVAKMIHFVRNTAAGVEMRSRFWIGHDIEVQWPLPSFLNHVLNSRLVKSLLMTVNRMSAKNMAIHCAVEYQRLASILPSLYQEFGPQM